MAGSDGLNWTCQTTGAVRCLRSIHQQKLSEASHACCHLERLLPSEALIGPHAF